MKEREGKGRKGEVRGGQGRGGRGGDETCLKSCYKSNITLFSCFIIFQTFILCIECRMCLVR